MNLCIECLPLARLYNVVAGYYLDRIGDLKKAENFYGLALSVASDCNSAVARARGLNGLATMSKEYIGTGHTHPHFWAWSILVVIRNSAFSVLSFGS